MKHFSVFPYSFLGTCSQHSSGLVKISLSLSCKQPVSNTKVAKSLLSVQRSFHSRLRVSKFLARYFILSLTHHLNPALVMCWAGPKAQSPPKPGLFEPSPAQPTGGLELGLGWACHMRKPKAWAQAWALRI